MGERSHGLQSWIDRLNEAELPALASVVQDLHRMAQQDKSSVQQLADVLLRDASLTSKVLKVANSVYYNPTQEAIRTISRAIVLIGFENVRLIGLSVSLIDSLLAQGPREQLPELLARSFHAAVQARNIAGYLLARSQEEVFIATLLHNPGELAFWGCGGAQADELATLLAQPNAGVGQQMRGWISPLISTCGVSLGPRGGSMRRDLHRRCIQSQPPAIPLRAGRGSGSGPVSGRHRCVGSSAAGASSRR